MFTKVGTIGVGVSNQDKALDFYVNTLGFEKIDDQPMSETERWLEVAPQGAQTHIMLGLLHRPRWKRIRHLGACLITHPPKSDLAPGRSL